MTIRIHIQSEADTEKLAQLLDAVLPASIVVCLDGTLGAGKTRLVQAFAAAAGVLSNEVTSPTYTLWQTYRGKRLIHHLDAYRVADEDEFDSLGFEECLDDDAVTFVEWGSRVEACLPPDRLTISLEVTQETARIATIVAPPALEDSIVALTKPNGPIELAVDRL